MEFCEYRIPVNFLKKSIYSNSEIDVYVGGEKNGELLVDVGEGFYTGYHENISRKINFCPMYGRKLREEE